MTPLRPQNLLAANAGPQRVTIGLDTPADLRRLSDARALTCPACGSPVVLHAGTVRAHHFAHLSGTVCHTPQSEPETEEHRSGKLLIARWLRDRLPGADVIVEAYLPATQQRADVLAIAAAPDGAVRRVAIEFQCAPLSAREWRRRHQLYRSTEIRDLWLLGGSRLIRELAGDGAAPLPERPAPIRLRTTELERALLWTGAPLLFLDAIGDRLGDGRIARFRPETSAQAIRPTGRLSVRPLLELSFPWRLLDWTDQADPHCPQPAIYPQSASGGPLQDTSERFVWQWLNQRHGVTPATLNSFFGMELPGATAFACTARTWQAAVYYRFIHGRVGDRWWLPQVEIWARAYLPVSRPISMPALKTALGSYQEALGAAGMLALPVGYGRTHAQITADLTTLPAPPDRGETLRLVRYRRTLSREEAGEYAATS